MNNENIFKSSISAYTAEPKQVLHTSDILPKTIKPRHVDGQIIQTGQSTDLPDGTTETKVFYELDTKKLKIWNSSTGEWDEVQLA